MIKKFVPAITLSVLEETGFLNHPRIYVLNKENFQ